jgi:uracil-DNA glycosylase
MWIWPYPKKGVADGIAFSCSHSEDGKVQPSLKAIFKEVQETVYAKSGEDWYSWDPDLTRWANQGILMLNTALTTEPGKIGVHYDLWKPFTEYLFNKLAEINNGLIYVFMGNAAKGWAKGIPESNYQLFCYHPASACYSGGEWDSNDLFNRVNEILEGNNNKKIVW